MKTGSDLTTGIYIVVSMGLFVLIFIRMRNLFVALAMITRPNRVDGWHSTTYNFTTFRAVHPLIRPHVLALSHLNLRFIVKLRSCY